MTNTKLEISRENTSRDRGHFGIQTGGREGRGRKNGETPVFSRKYCFQIDRVIKRVDLALDERDREDMHSGRDANEASPECAEKESPLVYREEGAH